MRIKFTYRQSEPVDGTYWPLQDDVRLFFDSIKSRVKTTAGEGDALLERSLPGLSGMINPDDPDAAFLDDPKVAARYMETRALPGAPRRATDTIHATLHEYEQRYLTGATGNKPTPGKSGLDILVQEFKAKFEWRGVRLDEVESNVFRVFCKTKDSKWLTFGTLYVANSRFQLLDPQPSGLHAPVYVDLENPDGRQYIRLPDGDFVRRYVIRGLSAYDGMRLSQGLGLTATFDQPQIQPQETDAARHGPVVRNLTDSERILSHTRGWKKRYISTGATEHPVYSTRGTQFHSMYGAVVVDLAKITNQHSIVDIHQLHVAERHLGSPRQLLDEGTRLSAPGTPQDQEKYLALRDVVRTRELLIEGSVDAAAVRKRQAVSSLVGIGAGPSSQQKALKTWFAAQKAALTPLLADHEVHTFKDLGTAKQWIFLDFKQPVMAQMLASARLLPTVAKVPDTLTVQRFSKFEPDHPAKGF